MVSVDVLAGVAVNVPVVGIQIAAPLVQIGTAAPLLVRRVPAAPAVNPVTILAVEAWRIVPTAYVSAKVAVDQAGTRGAAPTRSI